MAAAGAAVLPPGPSLPAPLLTLGWIARPLPLLERWRAQYGDTFTLSLPHETTWVMLTDPEDVKTVFKGDPRLLHAGEANLILRPVLGDHSVLLLDDDQHLAQRKLMLPPFHGDRMLRHVETMAGAAREEIARWPIGEPFALHPHMQAVTLEVIMRVVFGEQDAARGARLREGLKTFLEYGSDPKMFARIALLGNERFPPPKLYHSLMDPVNEEIFSAIRRRRAEEGVEEREDILSMLVSSRHEDGT